MSKGDITAAGGVVFFCKKTFVGPLERLQALVYWLFLEKFELSYDKTLNVSEN